MKPSLNPKDIDALLPQTQCGLCGFGGCMPYAEALLNGNAPINLCPPGGTKTLQSLGAALNQNPAPFMQEMQQNTKPPAVVVIREEECIGCTKCITACPVDAIIGSAKQMHTVLLDECSGCELCIPACPVDCIDLVALRAERLDKSEQYRSRYQARSTRLSRTKEEKKTALNETKKKAYILAAIQRAKAKKVSLKE